MEKDPKKEELDLLYEEDLIPALDKLGVKDKFLNGEILCVICGDAVTEENLYSFFLEGETLKMTCSKSGCIEKLRTSQPPTR